MFRAAKGVWLQLQCWLGVVTVTEARRLAAPSWTAGRPACLPLSVLAASSGNFVYSLRLIYMYIYIYMCVCVCVCARARL